MNSPLQKGTVSVLADYFGKHPGQSLGQFSQELKALSDTEKLELAQGAAKNLGLTQAQVSFPLS